MKLQTENAHSHPEFGEHITTRCRSAFEWVVIFTLLAGVSFVVLVIGTNGIRSAVAHHKTGEAVLTAVAMVGVVGFCIWCGIASRRRVEFYQAGAVDHRYRGPREYPYDLARSLLFAVTKQYYNGIYIGTVFKLGIGLEDGRSLRLSGRYRLRHKGAEVTEAKLRGEPAEELEKVKALVSQSIAAKLLGELSASNAVDWCKAGTITHEGVIPKRGRRKRECVGWAEIADVHFENGAAHVYEIGHKRPFLTLQMGAENFAPCFELFCDLGAANTERAAA